MPWKPRDTYDGWDKKIQVLKITSRKYNPFTTTQTWTVKTIYFRNYNNTFQQQKTRNKIFDWSVYKRGKEWGYHDSYNPVYFVLNYVIICCSWQNLLKNSLVLLVLPMTTQEIMSWCELTISILEIYEYITTLWPVMTATGCTHTLKVDRNEHEIIPLNCDFYPILNAVVLLFDQIRIRTLFSSQMTPRERNKLKR